MMQKTLNGTKKVQNYTGPFEPKEMETSNT